MRLRKQTKRWLWSVIIALSPYLILAFAFLDPLYPVSGPEKRLFLILLGLVLGGMCYTYPGWYTYTWEDEADEREKLRKFERNLKGR